MNNTGTTYASWTFRKKEKFFDVLTYTGNNEVAQTVSHDLGVVPAMIIIKSATDAGHWYVWHKDLTSASYILKLNSTGAEYTDSNYELGINATDTTIYIDTGSEINYSGTYVAYLFADNSSEDADDQMIKCGSVTTGNVSTDVDVNLGWQPQWILMKKTNGSSQWFVADTMRGWINPTGVYNQARFLTANTTNQENNGNFVKPTATGFTVVSDNLGSAQDWIYMAIRAPMMKKPEAATDVFALTAGNTSGTLISAGFPPDFMITKGHLSSAQPISSARLTSSDGKAYMATDSTAAEAVAGSKLFEFDLGNNFRESWGNDPSSTYMWKRAKGYMDVVAYTGDGIAGRAVPHSLGVAPEMMWVKSRTVTTRHLP